MMEEPDTPDRPEIHDWNAQLAAATAWWREAGVDCGFTDDPRDWLEATKAPTEEASPDASVARAAPTPPPPVPRIGGERSRWPATLADFAAWWLTEPSLDPESGARRVLPSGPQPDPHGAALMVLVGQPEADDREALLEGPQGRLLDAMLGAFGLTRAQTYIASVLPRHTPVADWKGLASAGMGAVVAHHIALAAPQRLLVFGRGGVSALVGHDPAQGTPPSPEFNHAGGSVPLTIAPALESLLDRPALKAGLWTRWLEWTDPR